MLKFCESLSEVMFKFVNIVMSFPSAPIGIGAAIAVTVSKGGLGILEEPLRILVGTLYGALIVFVLCVFVPHRADLPCAARPIHQGGEGAVAHRVHDSVVGSRVSTGDGANGTARCAAAHRRVRVAHRLFFQP